MSGSCACVRSPSTAALHLAHLPQNAPGKFATPDFILSKSGNEYVLLSPAFETLPDATTVRDRTLAFLELLNGGAKLALENCGHIGFGGAVYSREADGRRGVSIFPEPIVISAHLTVSFTLTQPDGSKKVYHPADPIRDWIGLASNDGTVALAFKLLSNGVLDWVNLYRILEVVESDCGGTDQIRANGWASKNAMKLFKHTACSPGAIGTEARHGAETTTPPPKPMLFHEARTMVLGIVQAWLRSKTTAKPATPP